MPRPADESKVSLELANQTNESMHAADPVKGQALQSALDTVETQLSYLDFAVSTNRRREWGHIVVVRAQLEELAAKIYLPSLLRLVNQDRDFENHARVTTTEMDKGKAAFKQLMEWKVCSGAE